MSNVLEFFLRMRDTMSGGLVRMAGTARQTFAQVQQQVDRTASRNRLLGQSFDTLQRNISRVENTIRNSTMPTQIRAARRELELLQRMSRNHIGNTDAAGGGGGGFNIKTLMKYAGGAFAGKQALDFGMSSVKSAMDYGMTEKSFGVLTGSASKGKALAGELNQLQQSTILGPEVFKAAQTMMAFGVQTEKVVQYEKMLGDVSMGNKDKFEALTLALSQTVSAGKLMGQDLLQYVNAGFNPLQVMSEHWQEFGLKSQKSVGQLKEMMEKGEISAAAVTKAFEVATGAGGKFAGMMNEVAQTSGGKLQILEGQFENFKIKVGTALMPVAENLMDAASKTLDWLNITQSAPAALTEESVKMNMLVTSITSLNEGNTVRKNLLEELKRTFPGYFQNMNVETAKNQDLLKSILDINAAYKDKISLAATAMEKQDLDKEMEYTIGLAARAKQQLDWYKKGNDGFLDTGMFAKYMQGWDNKKIRDAGFDEKSIEGLEGFLKFAESDLNRLATAKNENQNKGLAQQSNEALKQAVQTRSEVWAKFNEFKNNPAALAATFGDRHKDAESFMKLGKRATMTNINKMQALLSGPGAVSAASLIGGNTPQREKPSKGAASAAQGITGGGPRQVTINIGKMVENMAFNSVDGKPNYAEAEKQVSEIFMRILNSGAKIQ